MIGHHLTIFDDMTLFRKFQMLLIFI